ncbi:MAG: Spy/CpxP family protein refolding chaperone [Alphaproteobacteria bacterium]|nr:Spy/CpxP family protein refolding chaperone [Alphaproteobacteria bacterium]
MTRTNVAALALLAGVAIAAPALVCSAADTDTQTAQAQTTAQPPQGAQTPSDQQGPGGGPGMRGREGREGREGHRGWMREGMNRSPRERCEDRLARRAGVIAYTVTKLNLTAQQKPLWDKLNATVQANADKERQLCASLPAEAGQQGGTFLDRMNRREQFMQARLQSMQQARPALEALYNALSPEQKAVLDHPFRR